MSAQAPTRAVLIGAGSFGAFIAGSSRSVPEIELVAVVDEDPARAQALAVKHGVPALTLDEALAAPDVDAVAIATPPSSHAALATRALQANKDVFCEKPLGATGAEAARVRALAETRRRVLVVDHVLRYNPLLNAIRFLQKEMAWRPIRYLFENDAADETLPRDHWFWDESRSGESSSSTACTSSTQQRCSSTPPRAALSPRPPTAPDGRRRTSSAPP
jgi:predicted dehydrogenase